MNSTDKSSSIDEGLMRLALDQAQNARLVGEVPVGAVIVRQTPEGPQAVSYTHLTLPTILRV